MVKDVELPKGPRRPGARPLRPRRGHRRPGRPGDPQPLAARAPARRRPRRRRGRGARRPPPEWSSTARSSARASSPAGWPSTAGSRSAWPPSTPGRWAPAASPRSRWPPPTARPPGSTPPSSTRPTSRPSPPGSPTPRQPKIMHNAKAAMRVFPEHGWSVAGVTMDTALAAYLVKPGRRSFALDALSVEYLGRELAPAGRRRRPARLRRGRRGRGRRPDDAGPRRPRPGRRVHRAPQGGRRRRPAARRGAAHLPPPGPHGALRHRRRPRPPGSHGAAVRRRGAAGREGGARLGRPRVQPRLAQAAPGSPLRRTGPAQDEEDQDRLHHGRRRAGLARRPDRARTAGHHAAPPRAGEAAGHRRGPDQDDRARTAASTPPSTRPSPRPAASPPPTPTCRTSRYAPTRAARSAGASWSARATSRC